MKVILVSFITSSNIGDQLIVKTLSDQLLKKHEVIKYSYNLDKENVPYAKSYNQEQKNSLLRKIYLNYLRKIPLVDKWRDVVNKRKLDKNPNWDEFMQDLRYADVVVLGGGNAIFDLTKYSSSYYNFNKIVECAKEMDKIVFASSIGIGPFVTELQIKKMNETLAKCDYVTVRDAKSATYVNANNTTLHLSVDPVFALDLQEKVSRNNERKKIGICLIDLMNNKQTITENDNYVKNTISLVKELALQEKYEIYLFSSEPRDYSTVVDVYRQVKRLSNVNYVEVNTIENLLSLYSSLDIVLGARMHSLIVAVSQEIPVIGFAWQPKVYAMFETIKDEGSVFDINSIGKKQTQIIEAVDYKLNNINREKEIKTIKKELQKKFDINYEILKNIEKKVELK